MDTTQKTREASLPESAQQRNGAVRSAQEQRSAAGLPKRPAGQEQRSSAPGKRQAAPETEKTPARQKRTAPVKEQPAPKQRKAAPKQEQPAAKRTAASQQRKVAPKQQAAPKQRKAAPKQEQPRQVGLPDSVSTKKRAYGNSKPKKKTTLTLVNDALKKSTQRSAEKIKARQAEREKGPQKKNRPQQPAPAVIYTQPQAFNRSRFFMQLLTVTAVVVALVLGLSVFFKVENITITGADVYSPWAVREASGITEGDNLLTFSHARAGAQIKANLPYVNSVRFGIKLPDTVNIIIEEEDVVYAIKTQDGTWWLMNSSGRMVEQTNSAVAANYTQVLGVTVDYPVSGERGVATESAAVAETDPNTGEEVVLPVSVTGAQRLNVALQILQALEDNDIVGEAASVDVTRLEDIILWYGTRYQVNLGSSANIDYKIACMNDVILQMSEYQSGILDISFTIWPNQVGYTPFG